MLVPKSFVGTQMLCWYPKCCAGAQNFVGIQSCVGTKNMLVPKYCVGAQITRSDVSIQIQPYRSLR